MTSHERLSVSNHQLLKSVFKSFLRVTSNKASNILIRPTGSSVTDGFPHKDFFTVSMSWRPIIIVIMTIDSDDSSDDDVATFANQGETTVF